MSRSTPGNDAAATKTERLLNLVICLLSTRMPLSKSRIRDAVPQYQATASLEAFDRMFERDKDELRDLGIPLSTDVIDPLFDDEIGYRIDRREYALPDLEFAPDEIAALVLAGRAWTQASLAAPARRALTKLRAAGVPIDDRSLVGIEPRVRTTEPSFDALRVALSARREVTFAYRKSGESSTPRRLRPWGLSSRRGHWYVTGFDVDRGAERVFRLSRIEGRVAAVGPVGAYEIPAEHDARATVERAARGATPAPDVPPAVLRVRAGSGHTLRRRARTVGEIDDSWSLIDVDYASVGTLADEVAGFGADVLVQAPGELVDAVRARLAGALGAHGGVA